MEPATVSIFVATSSYLFVKMFSNSIVQGYCRFRYKSFKYREDESFFRAKLDTTKPQPELLTRADAAWRNDLENIPMFIVAALCAMFSGVPEQAFCWISLLYCAARTLHTITLLASLQPWRFIFFFIGMSCTSALFIWSLHLQGW